MHTRKSLLQNLINAIKRGSWLPGSKLPSVRELAHRHSCSLATMAAAVKELADLGYVVGKERRGVFVEPEEKWGERISKLGTRLIGVLLQQGNSMLQPIEAFLRKHGYETLFRHAEDNPAQAHVTIEEWSKIGVSGMIWSPLSTSNHEEDNAKLASAIMSTGLPAVALDRYPRSVEVNCVVSDNAQAACQLTEYLLQLGHQRIGLLRHRHGSTPEDRQQGYERALRQHGIDPDPALVLAVDHDINSDDLVEKTRAWLLSAKPTAAWSITSQPLGAAIMAAAQSLGLMLPNQLSIATFEDLVAPWPVTRIIQPFEDMALRASQLLLEMIKRPSSEIHRIVLRSAFIEGKSCVPPPTTDKLPKRSID